MVWSGNEEDPNMTRAETPLIRQWDSAGAPARSNGKCLMPQISALHGHSGIGPQPAPDPWRIEVAAHGDP